MAKANGGVGRTGRATAGGGRYTPGQRAAAITSYFATGSMKNTIASIGEPKFAQIETLRHQYNAAVQRSINDPRSRGAMSKRRDQIIADAKRIARDS